MSDIMVRPRFIPLGYIFEKCLILKNLFLKENLATPPISTRQRTEESQEWPTAVRLQNCFNLKKLIEH